MRLEYYSPVESPLLHTLLNVEIGLTALNVVVYICVIGVVLRTPFHINLKILYIVIVVYFYVGVAARLTTVAAILGVIEVDAEREQLNGVVFCASFVRMFFFATVSFAPSSLYFERRIATWFLDDYERKHRLYISLLISFYMTVGSIAVAFVVIYEIFDWILLVAVTVIQSLYIAWRFSWLENKNLKKLRRLNRGVSLDRYSLSMRFQLDENMRVMKLMRYCFIMLIAVNLFSAGVYLVANLPSVRAGNPEVWQLLDTIFNIIVNLDGYLVPLTILYVDDTYKKIVKEMKLLSWVVFWYKLPVIPAELDHGSIYFSSLQLQWDTFQRRVPTPPGGLLASLVRHRKKEHG